MDGSKKEKLNQSLVKSIELYDRLSSHDFVVSPSLPILYFGDIIGCMASSFKVVTAALNPSELEFKGVKSDVPSNLRFPEYHGDEESLFKALNAYFLKHPYRRWFGTSRKTKSGFLPFIEGMGSSYYAGFQNLAVHTDICSPLATSPSWSGLESSQKSLLIQDGLKLWKELMTIIAPDVVLISLKKEYLNLLPLRFVATIYTKPVKNNSRRKQSMYSLEHYLLEIDGKMINLIWGSAQNTPLQPFTDKGKLGEFVFNYLYNK